MAKSENKEFNSSTCDLNREILNNKIDGVEKNLGNKIENIVKKADGFKQDMTNCQKSIKESLKDIVDGIKEDFKEDLDKVEENLKDKISVSTTSINEKIDGFDKKIRGNGGVGMEEKIRTIQHEKEIKEKRVKKRNKTIKWSIIILFFLAVLVSGGSAYRFTLPKRIVNNIGRAWDAITYDEIKEQEKIAEKEIEEKQSENIDKILKEIEKMKKDHIEEEEKELN